MLSQSHGSLFVLRCLDEEHRVRTTESGKKHPNALFKHGVKTGECEDYCSIAFVFRTLDDSAFVPASRASQKVIPKKPVNDNEANFRQQCRLQRREDDKEGSKFKETVKSVRANWRRLFTIKGWTGGDE